MNRDPDAAPPWRPNTTVFVSETGDLIIKVELSSLRSDELEITVDGRRLQIKGVRHDPELTNSRKLLVNKICIGPFENLLEIPGEFDTGAAKAHFRNGTLRILVPRKTDPTETFIPPWRMRLSGPW